ncbi:hypothetical protein PYW08_002379 [Mythimna loreyi]|uniref:Uncharacterized protein n=1 Tax=Mythimna loreyi TaxID=667449 RepID=A0ACC2R1I7_9NEOP|nr:hypothetical protein PYW08_002379 [Mythimna loreyi]
MSQFFWKISFGLLAITQITQAWKLVCYLGSLDNSKSVEYTNAAELITSGYFNITKKTIVHAHGYRGNLTTQGTDLMMATCLSKPDLNCCAVDYAEEANFGQIPYLNFPLVVAKAYLVQNQLAQAWKILWQNGMKPETMHVMGLSLGAHVCGNAARTFRWLTNQTIARATGMDPAKPSYDGAFSIMPRIDQSCADFVDIIHTDTNRNGMATPTGHVDFFPNIITYRKTGVQEGCPPINYVENPPLSPKDACSHRRSLNLYVDAWCGDDQLLAAQASDEDEWASANFVPKVIARIGESIDTTLRGQFYLRTAGEPPYGLGEAGLTAQ